MNDYLSVNVVPVFSTPVLIEDTVINKQILQIEQSVLKILISERLTH